MAQIYTDMKWEMFFKFCDEVIVFQNEDGSVKLDVRLVNESLWMSQAEMAELFQTSPQNITLHLKNIYEEGELGELAICKDYLQVRQEVSWAKSLIATR